MYQTGDEDAQESEEGGATKHEQDEKSHLLEIFEIVGSLTQFNSSHEGLVLPLPLRLGEDFGVLELQPMRTRR